MTDAPPPGAALPSLAEALAWAGAEVDDLSGTRVGKLQTVYVDAESGQPVWLVVVLGRRRTKLVAVPVRDCAGTGRRVWTVHGHDALASAPAIDPTRPLLREHELTICGHYGIGEGVGRAAEVAGRAAESVTSRPAA